MVSREWRAGYSGRESLEHSSPRTDAQPFKDNHKKETLRGQSGL